MAVPRALCHTHKTPRETTKLGGPRPKLRVATLNLGRAGLGVDRQNKGRANEVLDALKEINFDVIGLSETHAAKAMHEKWTDGELNGCEIHTSAEESQSHVGGVGFLVHRNATSLVKEVKFTSHRTAALTMRIPGSRRLLKIVQVYAPHTRRDEEEVDDFYAELEAHLDNPGHITLVIGDMNAKIGRRKPNETYIGTHSAENRNLRGERMAAFAESKKLYVMNSFFEKPLEKRWTWKSNMTKVPDSEIDYILCNKRRLITNVEVLSKTELVNLSDHKMVRATLDINMKMRKYRPQTSSSRILDNDKMKQAVSEVNWKPKSEGKVTRNRLKDKYEDFLGKLKQCANSSKQEPRKHCPRITDETAAMLRKLKEERQKGKECTQLAKEVRARVYADYENHHIERLLKAVEQKKSIKKCKKELAQMRSITGGLRDNDGTLQTDRTKIEDICKRFYTELFASTKKVERIQRQKRAGHEEEETLPDVTIKEVEDTIKSMKNGKAPGPDGITIEMLKAGGRKVWEQMAAIFTECIRSKRIPIHWKESKTILIYKKGDPQDIKNYRPICLLSQIYKVFTKIILNRITRQLDKAQPREQAGFRSGYSTLDHLQTINQLQEKARANDSKLFLIFVDYEKAFDSIEINEVLNALEDQGIEQQYVDLLEEINTDCHTTITLFDKPIVIPIQKGVRQGDTISPKLFTAALERIFRKLQWDTNPSAGVKINGERLTHLRFADDIALTGNSIKDVSTRLEQLNSESEKVGLKINKKKTEWLHYHQFTKGAKITKITLGNEEIRRVSSYVYLGQEQNQDHAARMEGEITRRIKAAWYSYSQVQEVLKKLKDVKKRAELFNTTVIPAMLYGCETWTLREEDKKRLQTTERAMERRILGYTLRHKKRNEYIRQQTKFQDAVEEATKRKLRWAGHVARREDGRWTKTTTTWKPTKKPPPNWGRPMKWSDEIEEKIGQNWLQSAQDREKFKALVENPALRAPRQPSNGKRSRRNK